MKPKKATTGALNKAERYILRLITEEKVEPCAAALIYKVREHLGIQDEFCDVVPKNVPIEYMAAIDLADSMARKIRARKSA